MGVGRRKKKVKNKVILKFFLKKFLSISILKEFTAKLVAEDVRSSKGKIEIITYNVASVFSDEQQHQLKVQNQKRKSEKYKNPLQSKVTTIALAR